MAGDCLDCKLSSDCPTVPPHTCLDGKCMVKCNDTTPCKDRNGIVDTQRAPCGNLHTGCEL